MLTEGAVLTEIGQPLEVLGLSIPPLRAGQVLVELYYSGLCQTQLLEIQGRKGHDPFLPHTLGHEGAGRVMDVGPRVTKVKPGDCVVLTWIKGEGFEGGNTSYNSALGPIRSGPISTFLRHAVVSENRVVPIDPKVSFKEAALLGCAIPTGAGIIQHSLNVRPGSSLAIFGLGGVGLSALLAACRRRPALLVAVDRVPWKLELARSLGATYCIHADGENVLEQILELTNGIGVDYAVEAAGKTQVMELAFQSVRMRGGKCVLAGNISAGERITLDPYDLIKGKIIQGSWGGETNPDYNIPMWAAQHLQGQWELTKLITHVYTLEEINQAFQALEHGMVGRAVLALAPSPEL